jgi:hypothetical protein
MKRKKRKRGGREGEQERGTPQREARYVLPAAACERVVDEAVRGDRDGCDRRVDDERPFDRAGQVVRITKEE